MSGPNGTTTTTTVTLTLAERESVALRDLTHRTGRPAEELLGDAVRQFLAPPAASNWPEALRRAAGIWKDRDDLPSLAELRGEWERRLAETG